jgi:hypothetical protein
MERLPEAVLDRFKCADGHNAAQLQQWYPDRFGEIAA